MADELAQAAATLHEAVSAAEAVACSSPEDSRGGSTAGRGAQEASVHTGGNSVLHSLSSRPPLPPQAIAASGAPPKRRDSGSQALLSKQASSSCSSLSHPPFSSESQPPMVTLPSLPSTELSFRHAFSSTGTFRDASQSDGSEHDSQLLLRGQTSSSGNLTTVTDAAALGGGVLAAAEAAPVASQQSDFPEIHHSSSTDNPLFIPVTAGQQAAAVDRGGTAAWQPGQPVGALPYVEVAVPACPQPYRTVSSESDAMRAAALELFPGRQPLPASRSPPGWGSVNAAFSGTVGEERSTVVQHSMAGDLHLPAAVAAAAGPAALAALSLEQQQHQKQQQQLEGGGGGKAPIGCGVKGGSTQQTPRMSPRPSQHSGSGLVRPSLREQHGKGDAKGPNSLMKGDGANDEDYDFDLEERSKPWYKRKRFWRIAVPLFIMIFFVALGIGFVVLGRTEEIQLGTSELQIWRLCFFIAGLPLIWWSGDLIMRLVVYGVERTMFTWRNALYYAYAIRRPMTNVIRAAAALGWWAGIMTINNQDMVDGLSKAYNIILKLWACVTLFMTANLIKVLLAKLLSSKFNKHSHLQKMHDSLRKEHLLHVLLQPRPKPSLAAHTESDDCQGENGKDFFNEDGTFGGSPGADSIGLPGSHPRTPKRSLSERTSGTPPRDGGGGGSAATSLTASPHKPPRLERQSVPERGRSSAGGRKQASSSFRNMLSLFRRNKQLSTISEEGPPTSECATATDHLSTPPGSPCPPSINIAIDGHCTPVGARSPVATSTRPSPSKAKALLEAAGSGELHAGVATSRQPSVMQSSHMGSPRSRGKAPMSRQTSAQGGRGLQRAKALKRDGQPIDKEEGRRADAMASAQLNSQDSMSERDVLAEKLVKMEKYIRKNALQVTFKDELTRTERRERVTSELEAKKLAFYLFWNVKADFSSRKVTMQDLQDFLPAEKDAARAFDMLDDDKDGTITLQDCSAAVVKIFRDRENLAASLKDTKTVVGKLETLLGCVVHAIFGFIYLAIFDVDVMQTYLAFSSLVLAFSFVFSSSLRQMYENVVFLFVIHPFDVGDTLVIDTESYKVEEINIQFSTLVNGNNAKVWYPNQKLMGAPFTNLTLSGNKGESFKVLVDLDTPGTVLDEVRAAAEEHIKANALEFNGTLGVSFNTSANPLKLTLSIYYEFTHNGVDGGRCSRARNKLFILLAQTLTRLGVRYTWPEVRERYSAGLPGGAQAQRAEAVLAAAAAGVEPANMDDKVKLL